MPRPGPSTPNVMLNTPRPAGPSSPPHTPKSASPALNLPGTQNQAGQGGPRGRQQRQPSHLHNHHHHMPGRRSGIHPVGNGPNFSYRPDSLRPDQLSPRSSSSSSAEESESDSSMSDSPPRSISSKQSRKSNMEQAHRPAAHDERHPTRSPSPVVPPVRAARMVIVESSIVVEELVFDGSDGSDDEEFEGLKVLRPYLIEYADSERSRSRSRNPPGAGELDRKMVSDLEEFAIVDQDDDADDDQVQRACVEQRRKRMSSGSITKRTVSERGSDSDREDLRPHDAVEPTTTRRMRRRVGNRLSLQVTADPSHPRIDECDEENSSEEIFDDAGLLARELPYYDYISMEVDSP